MTGETSHKGLMKVMVEKVVYVVNQFEAIREQIERIEADRLEAQRLLALRERAKTLSPWRTAYHHGLIIDSAFWNTKDAEATLEWFDTNDMARPDQTYIHYVRNNNAGFRRRNASRPYMRVDNPRDENTRTENTITLFARLMELGLLDRGIRGS